MNWLKTNQTELYEKLYNDSDIENVMSKMKIDSDKKSEEKRINCLLTIIIFCS